MDPQGCSSPATWLAKPLQRRDSRRESPATLALSALLTTSGAACADGWVNKTRRRLADVPDALAVQVSVENQFPADLFESMVGFIEQHPQWDQYRLMQSALAGFLFQHGCQDRPVVRHYLDGLFRRPEEAGQQV